MFDQGFSAPWTVPSCSDVKTLEKAILLAAAPSWANWDSSEPRCVAGHAQGAGGRKLLHAVVPVGQAGDVLVFHRAQQLATLGALLEAIDGVQVIEQEGQVEDLELLGVLLEFRQRRRQQLHFVVAQCLEFIGVTIEGRIGVDLYRYLAWQPLFDQALEHQRTLALGRVLGHHVGELDDDGFGLGECAGDGQHKPGKGNDRFHERLFILVGWQCVRSV